MIINCSGKKRFTPENFSFPAFNIEICHVLCAMGENVTGLDSNKQKTGPDQWRKYSKHIKRAQRVRNDRFCSDDFMRV